MDRSRGHGGLRLSLVLRSFEGILHRAVHPRSGFEPLTGRWSAKHGGRFNRPGREALYLSLSPLTSLKEVARDGRFQPTLFISIQAKLEGIADAAASNLDEAVLSEPEWARLSRQGQLAPPQALAETLIEQGATGLLVRSFAPLAGPADLNLVLWRWDASTLRVIDDEKRLTPGS